MKILGIETSCDETAASVYTTEHGVVSNVLFSQVELQKLYGGVVPEIASRSHLEKIAPITQEALETAGISLDEIDAIAVTNKPGLPGSLLVGVCFAKALAFAKNKKIIGINHLEGHVYSACIENKVVFPSLVLTASGGHTSLYLVRGYGDYDVLGTTLDDAAGEAFDKIAKLMNVPYPGGPLLEELARQVSFQDFYSYPHPKDKSLNFSFSGLKTAVLYDLVAKGAYDLPTKKFLAHDNISLKQQVASSLHHAVARQFEKRLSYALSLHAEVKSICFVGGVVCNAFLRSRLANLAVAHFLPFFYPSRQYCTDNAAMIAFVGHYKAQQGLFDDLSVDIY